MVKPSSPRHAHIGYPAREYTAYWQWLNAITAGYADPENKASAVSVAVENMRSRGKHVAKEEA